MAAVLLYHAEVGWMPGGFLGVEVFFVISGYLITSLLLSERAEYGSVGLRGFWVRRAKRLLPAVFTLAMALLAYAVIFLPDEVASLRGDAAAAAVYMSNWYLIFDEQSYFETFGRPSMLRHLWSLAVEEQFYLVWPVLIALVFGRIRPRYAVPVIVAGAAASAVAMAVQYDPRSDASTLYYGTHTRLSGLLLGSALAFVWAPGRLPALFACWSRYVSDACGLMALAGLIACCALIAESDAFLYQGGFALVGALTVALIATAVNPHSHVMPRLLGGGLLVWAGLRSYSIYLWHWPVFMLTRPGVDIAMDGLDLFALRIAITLVLAEASYRLVETPIRRGALARLWRSLRHHPRPRFSPMALRPFATILPAIVGVVVLGFSVAAADPPPPPSYLAAGEVRIASWSNRTPVSTPGAHPTARPATSPLPQRPAPATLAPTLIPSPAVVVTPPPVAQQPVVAVDLPVTETPAAEASHSPPPAPLPPPPLDAPAARVLAVGDSVMLSASYALVETIPNLEMDAAVARQVAEGIEVLRARRHSGTLGDVVIVHLGTNGTFQHWEFDQLMELLSGVKRVVFVNVRVPLHWEGGNNAVIAEGVTRYPNAVLLDWYSASAHQPGLFYEDGVHLEPPGAYYYADLIASFSR